MNDGLEGVIAARTVLSHADGEHATVWVRGHPIAELVARHGYEGTVALMWDGFAGPGLDRARIVDELGAGRALAFSRLDDWLPAAARRPPIEGLRMALAALPDDSTPAAIAATLPVAVAALLRARNGKALLPPDPALATAADLLRMINGAAAEAHRVAALDAYLTIVIDNGLGTSTFAARVVVSTRASLAAAVLGGYCAFTGALHGGAPGLALDMLDEIAASGDIDQWLDRTLAAGGRLMGFTTACSAFAIRAPTSCAWPCCSSIPPAGASPSRRRSSVGHSRPCNGASPDGAWRPISRWTRRCCSTPSVCRAKPSRRSSPWRVRRPGSPTRSSSRRAAA